MAQQENFNELVKRLENVALRLESLATKQPNVPQINTAALNNIVLAPINSYDDLINNSVLPFVQVSIRIGDEVKQMAELVEKLFQYQRSFLIEVSKCSRPSLEVLTKFYEMFSKYIESIIEFRENHRKSEYFNHYSAISESISAMSWIAIQPAPAPFVYEMIESAKFYTNRVLRDFKERGPNHPMWVSLWLKCLGELEEYIKKYHTTGLVWDSLKKSEKFDPFKVGKSTNAPPITATSVASSPKEQQATTPPKEEAPSTPVAQDVKPTISLAEQLNKGCEITNSLKKVTDDQKTHKNPALRATNLVSASETESPAAPATPTVTSPATNKKPVFELEDKKWKIENQYKQNNLIIENTDIKQTVYVYQCSKCTVIVKGKVNSISIDSCQRVDLLFDDVLSMVEFINSKNVQMQVMGKVPTISIEKTDGCQIFLSKTSLDTEIVSSKSSSMNILLPNETNDDYVEYPVPEQFKTVFNNEKTKLITSPTESC